MKRTFDRRTIIHTVSRTIGAIGILILALASQSQPMSAQIDRTKQPEPGPAPKAAFPHYEEFKLSNGLKVFFVHDPRPLVTFHIQFRGGIGGDGDMVGLSDATADMLTRGGAGSHSAQQFAEEIDFLGGSINSATSADAVTVTASGLKKHAGEILTLFADVIKHPMFSEDEFAKYKNDQITAVKSAKSNPEFLASGGVDKLVFGDTPWGQTVSEESLTKLTTKDLRRYYDQFILPTNATIAVIGDMTKDEVKSKLESVFKDWKGGKATVLAKPKFPQAKGRRIILIDRPTSVQSSIRMVAKGPAYNNPDRPKVYILNSIFGAGTGLGNRLASNLRETHAYTYTPYSYFDSDMNTGYFLASADVRNAVTDSAMIEMMNEVERIQREPVPAEELERNVRSAVGVYLMSIANPTTTAVRVQSIDFYGLPKDYYNKLVDVYSSVKANDVLSLAKKYLNKDDISFVVVGKADEIKPKLEKLGKVEVWGSDFQPVTASASMSSIDGMTADQVWGKVLDAMGGKAKLHAVKALKTTGSITLNAGPQKFSGSVEKIEAAPNKVHDVFDIGVLKQEKWGNGLRIVVARQGQQQVLEGEELEKELESSHILNEAYAQELGAKLSLKGKKDVDGKQAFVLEANFPKGGPMTYYIDATTFLPVKQEGADGNVTRFNGWTTVGDIKQPSGLTIEPQPGVTLEVTDMKYELNPNVDPSIFEKK